MDLQTHVTEHTPVTLPWWASAVTYQVYVRSFADANGDGIGDLHGLHARLPYIASLGVDAVWLNPCYPSPQRDHGYDVADYFDIDPDYGDLEVFDALLSDARDLGIRILMDVVPNHCSDQHPWFRAACATPAGSDERARFYFRDGRGPDGSQPPNDWTAIFGGSAWTRVTEPDGSPGQWYLGAFTPHQPDFDWDNAEVVEHFDQVLRFWFDRGVAGFRVDAVTVLGKAEGLPDLGRMVPFGGVVDHFNFHPSGHRAWRHWRRIVDEYNDQNPGRDVFLIAEAYTPKRPDVLRRYVSHDEFHQGFCFELTLSPWNVSAMTAAIAEAAIPLLADGISPAWALNNHDVQRSVTRYGRADATQDPEGDVSNLVGSTADVDLALGRRRARAAMLLMLGLPGSSFLYAGEELGLPEVLDLPDEARQDPIVALTDGQELGRDGCRVPLPWTVAETDGHGFSMVAAMAGPWLPQPGGWGAHSVQAQEADQGSMLALVRRALAVRRELSDLATLHFAWLDSGHPDVLAFRRGDVMVVLNAGTKTVTLPAAVLDGRRAVLSSLPPSHNQTPSDPSTTEGVVEHDSCVWLTR